MLEATAKEKGKRLVVIRHCRAGESRVVVKAEKTGSETARTRCSRRCGYKRKRPVSMDATILSTTAEQSIS